MVRGLALLFFSSLLSLCPASLLAAPPTVTFEKNAVRASGLTPGAQAICFSIAQKGNGYDYSIARNEKIAADADKDGAIVFAQDGPVVFHSIWVVADLTTGETAIATPSGFETKLPLAQSDIKPGAAGRLSDLAVRADALEVLLIRPRAGAWRLLAYEGGRKDKDGARNGVLSVGIEQLLAIGNGPAVPAHFQPGDLLVLIEPRRMQFASLKVAAGEGVR